MARKRWQRCEPARGVCPVCGHAAKLGAKGQLLQHFINKAVVEKCAGRGLKPTEVIPARVEEEFYWDDWQEQEEEEKRNLPYVRVVEKRPRTIPWRFSTRRGRTVELRCVVGRWENERVLFCLEVNSDVLRSDLPETREWEPENRVTQKLGPWLTTQLLVTDAIYDETPITTDDTHTHIGWRRRGPRWEF